MPCLVQIIREPRQHEVPEIIETEKSEAHPQQVAVKVRQPEALSCLPAGSRGLLFCPVCERSRESKKPRNQPDEAQDPYQHKGIPPAIADKQPGNSKSSQHEAE